MTKPEPTTRGVVFDLTTADRELRHEDAYAREGHAGRTLVREPDLRIVLLALKAGDRIPEHRADTTASIHTLSGHVRLHLEDHVVELPAGRLLALEGGLRHDVEAVVESTLLLTLGRPHDR
jgi:quercetin dioxygenase-like cupin family protein